MARTLTMIPFFTDDIKIKPHTATLAIHLNREITIGEFAGEHSVSLHRIEETGEYVCETGKYAIEAGAPKLFIEGPEV